MRTRVQCNVVYPYCCYLQRLTLNHYPDDEQGAAREEVRAVKRDSACSVREVDSTNVRISSSSMDGTGVTPVISEWVEALVTFSGLFPRTPSSVLSLQSDQHHKESN
jgi:hypothetical protein